MCELTCAHLGARVFAPGLSIGTSSDTRWRAHREEAGPFSILEILIFVSFYVPQCTFVCHVSVICCHNDAVQQSTPQNLAGFKIRSVSSQMAGREAAVPPVSSH